MSALADPLAKPVWPEINGEIGASITSELETLLIRVRGGDLGLPVYVGFNSVMEALENRENIFAIFVCRSDIPAQLAQPLGIASAALKIRLVALPKGASQRLSVVLGTDVSVVATVKGIFPSLDILTENIGPAKADWVYNQAQIKRRPKK